MSRWQLQTVFLYSHDSRRREIVFDLNAVNIVTGPSGSGKSAICEIIDYCLGAGECHIPGVVRDASSWVAVLLSKDSTQFFVARRIPPPHQTSSEDTYIAFGTHVDPPANAARLTGTTNVSTMLRRFEQVLGIGDVTTEVFGANRSKNRITARNITPFLIQDDDVIINKTVLLRGAQDNRRFSIIDTFPYFLGAVDEQTIAKEQELRRLTTQQAAEQRRLAELEGQRDTTALALRSIAAEAQQVGLVEESIHQASVESLRSELQRVSQYTPEQLGEPIGEGDRLTNLTATERRLNNERVRLMKELDDLREAHQHASAFIATTDGQHKRLQAVDLFKTDEPKGICPLCSNQIMEQTETLTSVRSAYRELQSQLHTAERERPQIDQYMASLLLSSVRRTIYGGQ